MLWIPESKSSSLIETEFIQTFINYMANGRKGKEKLVKMFIER